MLSFAHDCVKWLYCISWVLATSASKKIRVTTAQCLVDVRCQGS